MMTVEQKKWKKIKQNNEENAVCEQTPNPTTFKASLMLQNTK